MSRVLIVSIVLLTLIFVLRHHCVWRLDWFAGIKWHLCLNVCRLV